MGEFLVILGTFKSHSTIAILATTGVVLGASYMLWLYKRVIFGIVEFNENNNISDVNYIELSILSLLAVFVFVLGVFPGYFIDLTNHPLDQILDFTSR